MRLIDVDKLKKCAIPCEIHNGASTELCIPLYQIDNAPTVEPFEPDYVGAERLKARQRGYEDGYHNGMKIGKTLNPKIKQGEWIDYSDTDGFIECPFCHSATTCEDNIDELHYCWKCGAKLRKGELYREETCENRFDCPSYQKQNCIGCENCKKGGADE